jgi:two-component system response regulator NreC
MTTDHAESKISILVVEDSPSTRLSITMMLAFDPSIQLVSAVGTGLEALEAIKLQPEVVLLDQTLPDLEALDLLAQIKMKLPTAKIIAMSVEERYYKTAMDAGAHYFLSKPFDVTKLLSIIHKVSISH